MSAQLPSYGGSAAHCLGVMVPLILSMADSMKAIQEAQTAQAKAIQEAQTAQTKALQQIAAALSQQSSASNAEGVKS